MSTRLDIVIFGATGFTGKFAVREILKLVKDKNITWGVAGRNEEKLKKVLQEVSDKTGEDLSSVPVIVADVEDAESLGRMAAQAKVVANCVGPYRLFGEPVVKACVAAGTHHVDVSGEPQYMEKVQLEYNKEAEEKGVYVISACGFDSIPADMGLIYFIQQFNGEVNAVETYLESETGGKIKGAAIHYGTWESAVHGLTHWNELRPLRQKLYPERLPTFTPKLEARSALHNSEVIGKWCTPFPGSDRPVMYRSQRFLYEHDKVRPVQVQAYVGFPSLLAAIMVILVGGIFALFTKTSFTRKLLLKHPKLFSAGFISHEGPSDETLANTKFSITFSGSGWTEKLGPDGAHDSPPNKTMVTRVSGVDPGYGLTTTALLLAGITILKEADKMPGKGGVLPPGAAFAKTSLIKDLSSYGFKFEVIKEDVKEDVKKSM